MEPTKQISTRNTNEAEDQVLTEHPSWTVSQWYAQPTTVHGKLIQYIIDPHHVYVNNRSKVCSTGMQALGIKKDAW